jgi:ferric-dicitrate binding protein FerR (iron transport regulator)
MDDLDWSLFDRYFAGVATADERDKFERWVAQEPERAAMVEALRGALAGWDRGMSGEELEPIWHEVAQRTGVPISRPVLAASPRSRPGKFAVAESGWSGRGAGWGVAASIVIAVGVALGLLEFLGVGKRVATVEERVVTIPRGQRASLQLPDGTHVLLGAGSKLSHPYVFPEHLREVTLEGEAYFTVTHDARRPFRVRAGDLVATDLGTEFMIRAYPEQSGGEVVVRSGTVALRAVEAESTQVGQVVHPGELGRLGTDRKPTVRQADTASYFAWTTGTLVFDGTPLSEALPQLSRWYDLDFRLADSSLGVIPLSGRMDQALTPSRLDLLARSMGLSQMRQGRIVTLFRSGSVAQ